MLKKILYSESVKRLNIIILKNFYNKKYLKGYYFEEKRYGFIWAWKGALNKMLGKNLKSPWPVGKNCIVSNYHNIEVHPDSINIFQSFGCYFQCHKGKIKIGKNVHIAPNVGVITTNHNKEDLNKHDLGKDILIGDNCWIGMNSTILPGVVLGDNTIVGAGAVVTKSFTKGNCVIAGVPAKEISEKKNEN